MNRRILTALAAFSLFLALLLTAGAAPMALALEPEEPQEEYAGYLVTLRPADPDRPTLYSVNEGLAALDLSNRIYKAGDLDHIRDLVYDGQVARVEPDYKAELFDMVLTPNDPYYQDTLEHNQEGGYQYNLFQTEVQAAWDVGLSGNGVTVAVIDSGLNLDHVDVPVKVAPGRFYFYLEQQGGRYTFTDAAGVVRHYEFYSSNIVNDDHPNGHGTMSTGIIAANTDNGRAIAGIAPNVTVIPIKCFTNERGRLGGYTSNLIGGLTYARENGADIINMSWGIQSESATLKEAIYAAANAGCILVAAAGNDGSASPRYPAAFDNVIGVGATDKAKKVCSFSQRNDSAAVYAPGYNIYSIYNTSDTNLGSGSGTSFSAPQVVGVAALLKEANPSMTQQDLVALLTPENCTPVVEEEGSYPAFGCKGIINVRKLLDAVGYAGVYPTVTDTGVAVRAAYHPKSADAEGDDGFVFLMGAYNAQGHLLSSQIVSPQVSDYGGFSNRFLFDDLGSVAFLRTHIVKADATLSAPTAPLTVPIQGGEPVEGGNTGP